MGVQQLVDRLFDICERAFVPILAICAHLAVLILLALLVPRAPRPEGTPAGGEALEVSVLFDSAEPPAPVAQARPPAAPAAQPPAPKNPADEPPEEPRPQPPNRGDPEPRDAGETLAAPFPSAQRARARARAPANVERAESKSDSAARKRPRMESLEGLSAPLRRSAFFGARDRGALSKGEWNAVDAALGWLAAHQSESGVFKARGFRDACPPGDGCGGPGMKGNDVALTGLALLAFLGAGHGPDSARYGDNVRRAAQSLILEQDSEGAFDTRMYNHAIATMAMAECLAMTGDPAHRASLRAAVRFAAFTQGRLGGWTYAATPRAPRNDTSITAWMAMALVSAAHAGADVPQEMLYRVISHFRRMTEPDGRVTYADAGPGASRVSLALEAAGVYCRSILGQSVRARPNRRAIARVFALEPRWDESKSINRSMYALFAFSLAARAAGGETWPRWRVSVADVLLTHQRRAGHRRGSWDPVGMWGQHGGRVYSTALCALILETAGRRAPGTPPPARLELPRAWAEPDLTAVLGMNRPAAADERARLTALRAAEKNRLEHYLGMWRALREKHPPASPATPPENLEAVTAAIESSRTRLRKLEEKIAALD